MVRTPLNVLLIATGGVAVVKAPALVRLFRKKGAVVRVVLTENAARFVTPLAFEAVSDQPVYEEMFARRDSFTHISLRQWADVVLIAPATANIMGKIAGGIADDLASTVAVGVAGAGVPRYLCPAMNDAMWAAPATQRNLAQLEKDGWEILGPASGDLACGESGPGRMLEPEEIVVAVFREAPAVPCPGKIIVTAGATRQPIDAVRFLSNRSTGKMGVAIAEAAKKVFSEVVLIHAALSVPPPVGVRVREALTAEAMLQAVTEELADAKALVMCAAVSDFTPETVFSGKLKKAGRASLDIHCVPAPDILAETKALRAGNSVSTIGFAMETADLEQEAKGKLERKGLDGIVANPLDVPGAGFGTGTNLAVYFSRSGEREEWPMMSKEQMADLILTQMETLCRQKETGRE